MAQPRVVQALPFRSEQYGGLTIQGVWDDGVPAATVAFPQHARNRPAGEPGSTGPTTGIAVYEGAGGNCANLNLYGRTEDPANEGVGHAEMYASQHSATLRLVHEGGDPANYNTIEMGGGQGNCNIGMYDGLRANFAISLNATQGEAPYIEMYGADGIKYRLTLNAGALVITPV